MDKGYVIINISEECNLCDFAIGDRCIVTGWKIWPFLHYHTKPDDCPIREMPNKMEIGDNDIELGNYADGRNDLIVEMFGEQ